MKARLRSFTLELCRLLKVSFQYGERPFAEVLIGHLRVAEQVTLGRNSDALATQKTGRNVNREGQRWTEDRAGMTLRLPIDLREAVTEEARVAGDLSRVVLFALRNVERKDVKITQTRKAGLAAIQTSTPACGGRSSVRDPRLGGRGGRECECDYGERPKRVFQATEEEQSTP